MDPFSLFGNAGAEEAPAASEPLHQVQTLEPEIDPFAAFGTPQAEELPGLTDEVLQQIFGGNVPEILTKSAVIEQAIAFIEEQIRLEGSCILRNWPAWLYHNLPFIGSTLLKGYAKNPKTCKKPYRAKDDANCGSGIHAFTLQGQEGLDAECAIMPIECEGRGAKATAARAEFERQHPGKVPLPYRIGKDEDGDKPFIMDVLRGVDASYREHEIIGPMLANSEKELTLIWVDEKSGCTCKARLDILCGTIIGDLKKCRDLDGFQWQIKDLFYNVQIGHYTNGAIACGLPIDGFALLPCEAFFPYRVAFWNRKPDKLEADRIEAERLVGLVKESTITGRWPNYSIPPWIHTLADIQADDLVVEF